MSVSAIDTVRLVVAHQDWANGRIFATANRADETVITRPGLIPGGNGDESVLSALGHIVAAEWIWYERWMGNERVRSRDPGPYGDLADIEQEWRERVEVRRQWLANLDDDVLGEQFSWKQRDGSRLTSAYWPSILHVAAHGTHHRAEACVALTASRVVPPELDLGAYIAAQKR